MTGGTTTSFLDQNTTSASIERGSWSASLAAARWHMFTHAGALAIAFYRFTCRHARESLAIAGDDYQAPIYAKEYISTMHDGIIFQNS